MNAKQKINNTCAILENMIQIENYHDKYTRMQEENNRIISEYFPKVEKILKVAKNYSVNYFNNCIPKGAIYGRMTRNLYVYIDNFQQFARANAKANHYVYIYMMDTRKESTFHKEKISVHSDWYRMFYAYIAYNNMFANKCDNVLCLKRGNSDIPKEKKSPQSNYNMSYKQVKVQNNERTKNENSEEIYINRDVNFDRYQQKIQVNDIIEKQNKYKKVVEDLRRGKCKNK